MAREARYKRAVTVQASIRDQRQLQWNLSHAVHPLLVSRGECDENGYQHRSGRPCGHGSSYVPGRIELHQLPPAEVEVLEEQTRVTVLAPQPLTKLDKPGRIAAVYQHACLRHVSNLHTNNASVRERFGISERSKAHASRILREAVDAGLVVSYDATAGPRLLRYVPFWAAPDR